MALPDYSKNGFYDPSQTYNALGSPNGPVSPQSVDPRYYQWYGTEQNPQGVFNAGLAKMGLGGLGSRAKAAQAMWPKVWQGYQAAKAGSNNELMFPEYLDQTRVQDIFNSLSYEQQGLDPGRFGQRPYRWSMRGT